MTSGLREFFVKQRRVFRGLWEKRAALKPLVMRNARWMRDHAVPPLRALWSKRGAVMRLVSRAWHWLRANSLTALRRWRSKSDTSREDVERKSTLFNGPKRRRDSSLINSWRIVGAALVLLGLVGIGVGVGISSTPTTTTTTTTTTVPLSKPQAGWVVATSSARGVMVDYTNISEGGATFRVLRLRARTTLLRWHDGYEDPPSNAGEVPVDAGPSIDWSNEGVAGVVAVFNGGFKKSAGAGGAVVDGVTLEPLVDGDMTIAINAAGHWSMGVWGSAGFPVKGFGAIAYRQNLGALILRGQLTPATNPADWDQWGSPLNNDPLTSRSGLGVDAKGNLLYAAAIGHVDVQQLALALQKVGAVTAMQLDINPFWPIVGASLTPLHSPGAFPVQLAYSAHNPTIYNTGWERDFFVALAEPGPWACFWSSPGLTTGADVAQPQVLHLAGTHCRTLTRHARKNQKHTTS